MASTTCLSLSRASDLSGTMLAPSPAVRLPRSRPRRSLPVMVRSSTSSSTSSSSSGGEGARRASVFAVSVAAATAGMLFSSDLALLTPAPSVAAVAPVEASASWRMPQVDLASGEAPALWQLADEEAQLTPAERARALAAELRRRKEEEAASKAAAAAAAEEAARVRAAEEAAARAAKAQPSFFGGRAEEKAKEEPVREQQIGEVQKAPSPSRKSKRGGMPLFVSQFGILAAYSGAIAAVVLVPESEWKKIEQQLKLLGEKAVPIIDDLLEKAKPTLEQVKEKGQELLTQAQPYVAKAIETAKPLVAEAVEKAKPLVAQAGAAVVAQVSSVLNKKEEEKVVSLNGSTTAAATAAAPASAPATARVVEPKVDAPAKAEAAKEPKSAAAVAPSQPDEQL